MKAKSEFKSEWVWKSVAFRIYLQKLSKSHNSQLRIWTPSHLYFNSVYFSSLPDFQSHQQKSHNTKVKHVHHVRRYIETAANQINTVTSAKIHSSETHKAVKTCKLTRHKSAARMSEKNSGKVKMVALTTRSSLWYTKYVPKSIFWNNWTEQQQTTQTCTTTALASCSKQYIRLTQPMIAGAISLQAKFPSWCQQKATFCSQ